MSQAVKISGVIITYNEERNIKDCILSIKDVVDEVLVVDSFSTDKTVEICESLGARVIKHPFEGHIQQKNYAMEQSTYDHVLSLDADERASEEMIAVIKQAKEKWQGSAYKFNRLNNYCGAWLKRSWYPDAKIRLWDRRKGKWGGENPHDRVIVSDGDITKVKADIIHYAYADLEEHFHQVTKFAIIAANAKYKQGKKASFLIHVLIGPWFKFIKRYLFQFGFLDGYYGFIFSALAAFVNFKKYLRLWELNRNAKRK
ncbi:MAG: glycosyltransferase family 2 protein [Flammeovirgaceae bacterium]